MPNSLQQLSISCVTALFWCILMKSVLAQSKTSLFFGPTSAPGCILKAFFVNSQAIFREVIISLFSIDTVIQTRLFNSLSETGDPDWKWLQRFNLWYPDEAVCLSTKSFFYFSFICSHHLLLLVACCSPRSRRFFLWGSVLIIIHSEIGTHPWIKMSFSSRSSQPLFLLQEFLNFRIFRA